MIYKDKYRRESGSLAVAKMPETATHHPAFRYALLFRWRGRKLGEVSLNHPFLVSSTSTAEGEINDKLFYINLLHLHRKSSIFRIDEQLQCQNNFMLAVKTV